MGGRSHRSAICIPRGVVHAFRNSSEAPRHLVVHASAAALELIEEVGRTSPDQWAAIFERHGSRLLES